MPVFFPQGRTIRVPCCSDVDDVEPHVVGPSSFEMQLMPVNFILTNPHEADVWVNIGTEATDLISWPVPFGEDLPEGKTHHGSWGFRLMGRTQMKISHGGGNQLWLSGLAEDDGLFYEITPGEGT